MKIINLPTIRISGIWTYETRLTISEIIRVSWCIKKYVLESNNLHSLLMKIAKKSKLLKEVSENFINSQILFIQDTRPQILPFTMLREQLKIGLKVSL